MKSPTMKPTMTATTTATKPRLLPSLRPKKRTSKPSGKVTEREVMAMIQGYYGLDCRVDRIPDTYDVGHYMDYRPCDLFVTIGRGVESGTNTIWYIECKETNAEKINLQFSVLNIGQNRAIQNTLRLRIPYFIVFQHLKSRSKYLIPATMIKTLERQGKKSMNEDELKPYLWKSGALYDNFE